MREVELQTYVPPVESVWTDSMKYKTVLQGRWRWDQEHINIKEGRVALMHVRRLCRSMKNYGKHHAFIGDNL
eukprot:5577297-Karenia_brevis.AAC.1